MSKYSTDELVKRTMRHWAWWWEGAKDATGISRPEHGFQYRDAIIARLRAADKLVAAWKAWKANPVKGTAGIVKAISDYEEGK